MSNREHSGRADNLAPGFLQRRRRTWIGFGIGLLALVALVIWAALSAIGWLWGQTQGLAGAAPEALRSTANVAVEQAKRYVPGALDQLKETVPSVQGMVDQLAQSVPGAREMLSEVVPALNKSETPLQRDVSGEELGPLPRYPGLVRTRWQRTDSLIVAEYEGKADYAKTLDYYSAGYSDQGFARSVQSASPEAETHDYVRGSERFTVRITKRPKGFVSVRIEAVRT